MATTKLVKAAKAALTAHEALAKSQDVGDAFEVGADFLPLDGRGWMAWYETHKPLYAEWGEAMEALKAAGYEGGNHPFEFKPFCKKVLAAEANRKAVK
jgi:hypothetical protein